MYYPRQGDLNRYENNVTEFGGLNRTNAAVENEFSDMLNMSDEKYPSASPRRCRAIVKEFKLEDDTGSDFCGKESHHIPTSFKCMSNLTYTTLHHENPSDGNNNNLNLYSVQIFIGDDELGKFMGSDYEDKYNGLYHKIFTYDTADPDNYKIQLVSMGAYVVIFPYGYYINTRNTHDKGFIGNLNKFEVLKRTPLNLIPCTADGSEFSEAEVSDTAPKDPKNGQVWVDTSQSTTVYKIWDEGTKQWVQQSTTYIKISGDLVPAGFSKYDSISISGLNGKFAYEYGDTSYASLSKRIKKQINALNQDGVILYDVVESGKDDEESFVESGYIIIAGILDQAVSVYTDPDKTDSYIKFERKFPDMDFVTEGNNRIWGCKFGVNYEGKSVNEIYACKLGDFKNWNSFMGLSTDSYVASLGSDGAFTGAVTYNGYPTFFKQKYIHKVYGSAPSSFQIMTTNCLGVAKGCENSLACVNNILYYATPVSLVAYDGSIPYEISHNLGRIRYKKVTAGGANNKVYFCCTKEDGTRELLVYNTDLNMWHKEDDVNALFFANDGHVLYFIEKYQQDNIDRYRICSVNDDYNSVYKQATSSDPYPTYEDFENKHWYITSSNIGLMQSGFKYIQKLIIKAQTNGGTIEGIMLSYDDEPFERAKAIFRELKCKTDFEYVLNIRRCDHFKYKIIGKGDVEIISVYKTYIQGSNDI
ncbi:MAG: hypothetical protein ACI4W6_07805 [Acutalibacteraceae bacterium]